MAMSLLAAGLTVMLSGYYLGGLLALPLAGAMAGAALAGVKQPVSAAQPCVGIGLIGLWSVLIMGRFFGSLPTVTLLALCIGPLAGWASALPPIRNCHQTYVPLARSRPLPFRWP